MGGDTNGKHIAARSDMVRSQLRARGINDQRVLDAFLRLPRERFMPPSREHEAYADHPVPIGHGQTISQPYIVALMVQELGIQPWHRVLDVGSGSGFQTAVLASVAQEVFAVERLTELAGSSDRLLDALGFDNVTIATLDGSNGWPEHGPYDRIICGAGAPDVPGPWLEQLADDGRIILPAGDQQCQSLLKIDRCGGQVTRRKICDVRFVKLIGENAWPEG